ncbi:thiamine diphosphokinase [Paratractidigestivibacter faecalis]|uniref:thiamine diphosphokinase n=1 Tax=Paratractidigestivibacter faecalis TaxID=2292441 RepID=UPI003D08A20B
MPITGAIFDCDGTLADSMGMWRQVVEGLLVKRGMPVPPDFYERTEPVSLHDGCVMIHEEFGLGQDAESLYEELCADVRAAYARVPLLPGARDFLQELTDAGIPMVMASSTPVRELRSCLETHGIAGFFKDVVSTEDVGGRDKEFPDVYEEALRRLGTPKESTWVFEDAPFGVQTSHRAGFNVVGLMNDHDGRREENVRPYCDVYAHGYAELSLALLNDYARPADASAPGSASGEKPLQVLVVDGSPEPSSPELVARLAAEADYVVCADGGAAACRAAGVAPDVFCGDADSASADDADWARAAAKTDIRFPAEKYATDLSLALDCARHEATRQSRALSLTLTCASGGRPDHALAVVGLLAGLAQEGAACARLVEDASELRVLAPVGQAEWRLGPDACGQTFSAVAVAPNTRIDEKGLKWELADKPMELLADLGISNVVVDADACVTCRSGAVAAFLLRG